jgi:hypothetical protein
MFFQKYDDKSRKKVNPYHYCLIYFRVNDDIWRLCNAMTGQVDDKSKQPTEVQCTTLHEQIEVYFHSRLLDIEMKTDHRIKVKKNVDEIVDAMSIF